MKVNLIIQETIVKEVEMEFDENTQSMDSFIDDIKGWYKNGVFESTNSTVYDVYGTLIDGDSRKRLAGFTIK